MIIFSHFLRKKSYGVLQRHKVKISVNQQSLPLTRPTAGSFKTLFCILNILNLKSKWSWREWLDPQYFIL